MSIPLFWKKPQTRNKAEACRQAVIDGDTLVVMYKAKEERVRLLCVDTEESCHPIKARNTTFGRRTTAHVKSLLPPGTRLYLQFEPGSERDMLPPRDRYNRILAYVFLPTAILKRSSRTPFVIPKRSEESFFILRYTIKLYIFSTCSSLSGNISGRRRL